MGTEKHLDKYYKLWDGVQWINGSNVGYFHLLTGILSGKVIMVSFMSDSVSDFRDW